MNRIVIEAYKIKQTDSCGKKEADGMVYGEGITQEHLCPTHEHRQQHRDWFGKGEGWDWVKVGTGEKSRNNCKSINNKNKIKKEILIKVL